MIAYEQTYKWKWYTGENEMKWDDFWMKLPAARVYFWKKNNTNNVNESTNWSLLSNHYCNSNITLTYAFLLYLNSNLLVYFWWSDIDSCWYSGYFCQSFKTYSYNLVKID